MRTWLVLLTLFMGLHVLASGDMPEALREIYFEDSTLYRQALGNERFETVRSLIGQALSSESEHGQSLFARIYDLALETTEMSTNENTLARLRAAAQQAMLSFY